MHETIFVNQILEEAKKYQDVTALHIEVGELAHVPLEDLKPTLEAMSPYPVILTPKTALVACACGYKGKPTILARGHDHMMWSCPQCETLTPKLMEGGDILLKRVEVK